DPNVVKVVTDRSGLALYFSRSPIPHVRADQRDAPAYFKHIGLYVYQRDFLLGYSGLPVGPLEKAERLEQLRALENGHSIRVVETEYESLGVDTPEDLERVSRLFEASLESVKKNGLVHLRDGGRSLIARKRNRGRVDRLPAREPWSQGDTSKVRSLSER